MYIDEEGNYVGPLTAMKSANALGTAYHTGMAHGMGALGTGAKALADSPLTMGAMGIPGVGGAAAGALGVGALGNRLNNVRQVAKGGTSQKNLLSAVAKHVSGPTTHRRNVLKYLKSKNVQNIHHSQMPGIVKKVSKDLKAGRNPSVKGFDLTPTRGHEFKEKVKALGQRLNPKTASNEDLYHEEMMKAASAFVDSIHQDAYLNALAETANEWENLMLENYQGE